HRLAPLPSARRDRQRPAPDPRGPRHGRCGDAALPAPRTAAAGVRCPGDRTGARGAGRPRARGGAGPRHRRAAVALRPAARGRRRRRGAHAEPHPRPARGARARRSRGAPRGPRARGRRRRRRIGRELLAGLPGPVQRACNVRGATVAAPHGAAATGGATARTEGVAMTVYARPGTEGAKLAFKGRYENYIGGRWVAPVKGHYFENPTPVTGQVFTEIPRSTAEDVELALDAAHAAAA